MQKGSWRAGIEDVLLKTLKVFVVRSAATVMNCSLTSLQEIIWVPFQGAHAYRGGPDGTISWPLRSSAWMCPHSDPFAACCSLGSPSTCTRPAGSKRIFLRHLWVFLSPKLICLISASYALFCFNRDLETDLALVFIITLLWQYRRVASTTLKLLYNVLALQIGKSLEMFQNILLLCPRDFSKVIGT